MADSFWVIDSEENLTDSCVRASEYYSDINDSTAFDRGSDESSSHGCEDTEARGWAMGVPFIIAGAEEW